MKFFRIIAVAMCVLVMSACTGSAANPMAVLRTEFETEVQGTVGKTAFCAKITVRKGEGEDAREVTVTYLAPDALADVAVRVTGTIGEDGKFLTDTDATVTMGDIAVTQNAATLAGWLSPAIALLSCGEIATRRTEGDTTVLTFPGEVTLTLAADGIPKTYTAPNLSFCVVWWEGGGAG